MLDKLQNSKNLLVTALMLAATNVYANPMKFLTSTVASDIAKWVFGPLAFVQLIIILVKLGKEDSGNVGKDFVVFVILAGIASQYNTMARAIEGFIGS